MKRKRRANVIKRKIQNGERGERGREKERKTKNLGGSTKAIGREIESFEVWKGELVMVVLVLVLVLGLEIFRKKEKRNNRKSIKTQINNFHLPQQFLHSPNFSFFFFFFFPTQLLQNIIKRKSIQSQTRSNQDFLL